MPFLIGTDEAGYGPNLGPLVVAATVWRIDGDLADTDLYARLAPEVVKTPVGHRADRLAIGDSKRLYQPGGGWDQLERGVWTALGVLGQRVVDWQGVWPALSPASVDDLMEQPWHVDFNRPLPRDVSAEEVDSLAQRFERTLARSAISLAGIQAEVVFPRRFNDLVDRWENKSTLLSDVTLSLVQQLLGPLGDEPILVHCDKHGGRNKYVPVLQPMFPEYLVEVRDEGRQQSVYRWGPARRRIEFRFVAKGENFLPSALASMVCKYLRELAMLAFNEFWLRHVPGLQPTAGYPEDAKRFKRDMAAAQTRLGIADRLLWRCR